MGKLVSYQKEALNKITNELGLEHSRLYRYADGRISLEKMQIGILLKLSKYFKVPPMKLYEDMLEYIDKNKDKK